MHHKLVKAVDLIAGQQAILVPGCTGQFPGLWEVRDKQWSSDGTAIELKLEGSRLLVVEPDQKFETVETSAVPPQRNVNAPEEERIRHNIDEIEELARRIISLVKACRKGTRS